MSIKSDLKKEGIEIISQIDTLTVNSIAKNISRRIIETFPELPLTESEVFNKLAKLNMYKAKMAEGMVEANYFYKNTSIYFNEHINDEDIEEFAIHECIHYLQERKDIKNNLTRMGLCKYTKNTPIGLALNESAVQYTASWIIGIEADFEKYYDITLYTPSPSYYPIECSLLNEIVYFTGNDILFKSTILSNDNFENKIIELTSENTFYKIQDNFDKILKLEEQIIKINSKISELEDGSAYIEKYTNKVNKYKQKLVSYFFETQNIIIKNFFDNEFNNITNLEELEQYRRKLYKFTNIIASIKDYTFFDNYYIEMMNKLEHKSNILENGGTETALSSKSRNSFITWLKNLLNLSLKNKKEEKNQIN